MKFFISSVSGKKYYESNIAEIDTLEDLIGIMKFTGHDLIIGLYQEKASLDEDGRIEIYDDYPA